MDSAAADLQRTCKVISQILVAFTIWRQFKESRTKKETARASYK